MLNVWYAFHLVILDFSCNLQLYFKNFFPSETFKISFFALYLLYNVFSFLLTSKVNKSYVYKYPLFSRFRVFFFFFNLCLCWVFVAWVVSSCGKQGLLSSFGAHASHCAGFSCCGAQALECRLHLLWHMCLVVCETFPEKGSNWVSVSPTSHCKFLTTGPPGNFLDFNFLI